MNDETIASAPDEFDTNRYMIERVEDQLSYYSQAATRAKRRHMWIQSCVIVCAAAVPVVVNLPNSSSSPNISLFTQILATLMALAVAILTGLANFRKDGDLWLSYRMTEELLKQEKYTFITRAGAYEDSENRFSTFVQRVEGIISSETNKFRALIEDSKRPSKESRQ